MKENNSDFYTENKSYYERNAHKYEASSWYYFNKYKNSAVRNEVKRFIGELGDLKEIRILELGAGTGYLLDKIFSIEKVPKIHYSVIEHSSAMVSILSERFSELCESFTVFNTSITSEELKKVIKSAKYELIIGSSILHHLIDYEQVIRTLSGILSDGGVMYFVREPIHSNECEPGSFIVNLFEPFYGSLNDLFMRPLFKKVFWPGKNKAEDVKQIAYHMFRDGVSIRVFRELENIGFKILFIRKYNRRVSSFFSYLENKWLSSTRKDIFGNTLFSICIKKGNS